MRTIKHPFITNLIYSFQTSEHLCLVMEYISGGELFFHLSREKKFSEEKSRFYVGEITCAIGYLHDNNIVYRDLKLENILLDNEGHIKLADFGLCKMNMNSDSKTHTFCGTVEYLAPEVISTEIYSSGYTRAVDWWALGVLVYEMLIGHLPFSPSNSYNDLNNQKNQNKNHNLFLQIIHAPVQIPLSLSDEARNLLLGLLEKDPSKRLGSSSRDSLDVKSHKFFNSINWNLLLNKSLTPPYKPTVSSEADTR